MSVFKDINLLYNFLLKENINTTSCFSYKEADKIYSYTNENMNDYPKNNLEDKKVLSVTSSADHILNACMLGAKEITAFDINRFCKYYSALKIAMIKRFDYDSFIKNATVLADFSVNLCDYKYQRYNKFNNDINCLKNIIDDCKTYLKEDDILFFNELIYILLNKEYKNGLFKYDNSDLYNNLYVTLDNYNVLKNNLNNCNITYVDCDIDNLSKRLYTNNYDVIFVSNIFSKLDNNIDTKKVLSNLILLLNKNGAIYDYDFYSKDVFNWEMLYDLDLKLEHYKSYVRKIEKKKKMIM